MVELAKKLDMTLAAISYAVKRDDDQAGGNSRESDDGPRPARSRLRRQLTKGVDWTLPPRFAEKHFRLHDRDANQRNAQKIDQYKGAAAIFSGNVRELPDITETYGGADRRQHKYQA